MPNRRYPSIAIRSHNELAKRISHSGFSQSEALALINDVIKNFNNYWRDNNGQSEPDKDKYVRSAKGTPLGKLLDKINKMVFAPHDKIVPDFIFGGVNGMNHVKAAEYLLGKKRHRVALKMDLKRFFEQVGYEKVYHLFLTRCGCSKKASKTLADLCCVPVGPKGSKDATNRVIARGFATSSRLAVWCNMDAFIRLNWLVKKSFKGNDPKIAIYVDDIGITVSKLSKVGMKKFSVEVQNLLAKNNLEVNDKKTEVSSYDDKGGLNHLGIKLERNRLRVGIKTRKKMVRLKDKAKNGQYKEIRKSSKDQLRHLNYYKKYVEKRTH